MPEVQTKPKVTVNGMPSENKPLGQQVLEVTQLILDVIWLLLKVNYAILESIYRLIVPVEPKPVAGKIVLITGTGHGIGKELALQYASLGATVVAWDVNQQKNEETVKEISQRGYPKAYPYQVDVSNRQNVLEVAKKVQREVGDVAVLVNNAGIMPSHPLWDHSEEEIERIYKINVLAHHWTLEAFLPAMKKKREGHIVALSSCAGLFGLENLVPYCGSKFAVRGMMEALHEDLRKNGIDGINITVVCPYMVNTGLCKKPRVRFASLMPMLEPEVVAKTIIEGYRRNEELITVPKYLLVLSNYTRLLPMKAAMYVKDFFDSGVDSDL